MMRPGISKFGHTPRIFGVVSLFALTLCLAIALLATPGLSAQASPEIVGHIEGQDFVVQPPVGSTLPEGSAPDILVSGSRVILRAGDARITLTDGGEILICGPAQFELLKSRGAVTVALDFGVLHLRTEGSVQISVFTPFVLATPVSVGGGALDATIGLSQDGRMCLRALRGAVRIRQQLGDQSLLVPQLGGLTLSGGQVTSLDGSAPGCTCKADVAKLKPNGDLHTHETLGAVILPSSKPSSPQVTAPSHTNNTSAPLPPPPAVDTPIFKVLMPPLTYNANSPEPPADASPQLIMLVRSVRVREETVFTATIVPGKKREVQKLAAQTGTGTAVPHPGVFARIGGFFRKIFGIGG